MNVLLIDDEKAVLDGMRYMFEKLRPQHRIVAAVMDPAQAYQYLAQERIDLVITDVRMPGLYGTELSKWIKINYPDTAVLVVSAYSDYEYVRTFIQLDAVDYLLKPVSAEELLACIDQVDARIRTLESRKKQDQIIQELVEAKRGSQNPHQDQSINIKAILLFKMDEKDAWEERLSRIEKRLLFGIAQQEIAQVDEHNLLIFEKDTEMERVLQRIRERIDALREESIHVYAAFYKNHGALPVYEAYERALRQLDFMTFNRIHGAYTNDDLKQAFINGRNWKIENYLPLDILRSYMVISDSQGLKNYVLEAFERLKRDYPWIDSRHSKYQIIKQLILLEKEIDFNVFPKQTDTTTYEKYFEDELIQVDTAESLLCWIAQFLSDICDRKRWQPVPEYISRVIRYIEENYMDDIGLTQAAEAVFVNPSYLSSQFKKYVGKSFNQYLTVSRIDHAKRLLTQNVCRIYEVSERVGFTEPSYFNAVFKKITGMTPKDFQTGKGR